MLCYCKIQVKCVVYTLYGGNLGKVCLRENDNFDYSYNNSYHYQIINTAFDTIINSYDNINLIINNISITTNNTSIYHYQQHPLQPVFINNKHQ